MGFDKLDLNAVLFSDTAVTYDEAVSKATTFDNWHEDVQISIEKAEKDIDKRCVRLEISY